MKRLILIPVLTLLCSCAHSTDKARAVSKTPSLAASIGQSERLEKLNRKSLDSAAELRRLELQSRTILEQLDYKAVKLLEE